MIDIRTDVPGLWCDDITFCPEQCGERTCPRNMQNIRDRKIPHSFSMNIPTDCPKLLKEEKIKHPNKSYATGAGKTFKKLSIELSDRFIIPCDLCNKYFDKSGSCPSEVTKCNDEEHWELLLERISANEEC